MLSLLGPCPTGSRTGATRVAANRASGMDQSPTYWHPETRKAMRAKLLTAAFAASVAILTASWSAGAEPEPQTVTCDLKRGKLAGLALDDRLRLRLSRDGDACRQRGEFLSEPMDLGSPGPVHVRWIEQWTAPQRWEKHAGNPIYGPKQSGDWDNWTNGVSVVRNPDGKSYKMFYSGRDGGGIGFAEAAIEEPTVWKENPASPVLKPRSDSWEGNVINQPRVVKVTDRHWRMYYTGWGFKGEGGSPWAIGLAESFDAGVTWKRCGDRFLDVLQSYMSVDECR